MPHPLNYCKIRNKATSHALLAEDMERYEVFRIHIPKQKIRLGYGKKGEHETSMASAYICNDYITLSISKFYEHDTLYILEEYLAE